MTGWISWPITAGDPDGTPAGLCRNRWTTGGQRPPHWGKQRNTADNPGDWSKLLDPCFCTLQDESKPADDGSAGHRGSGRRNYEDETWKRVVPRRFASFRPIHDGPLTPAGWRNEMRPVGSNQHRDITGLAAVHRGDIGFRSFSYRARHRRSERCTVAPRSLASPGVRMERSRLRLVGRCRPTPRIRPRSNPGGPVDLEPTLRCSRNRSGSLGSVREHRWFCGIVVPSWAGAPTHAALSDAAGRRYLRG